MAAENRQWMYLLPALGSAFGMAGRRGSVWATGRAAARRKVAEELGITPEQAKSLELHKI